VEVHEVEILQSESNFEQLAEKDKGFVCCRQESALNMHLSALHIVLRNAKWSEHVPAGSPAEK
jgi:hypothetical protein